MLKGGVKNFREEVDRLKNDRDKRKSQLHKDLDDEFTQKQKEIKDSVN